MAIKVFKYFVAARGPYRIYVCHLLGTDSNENYQPIYIQYKHLLLGGQIVPFIHPITSGKSSSNYSQ